MMQPSLMALRAFEVFFRPWMRSRVRVLLSGLPRGLSNDLPLLIVANHVSWWDGFTLREIHRLLRPGAPLRVVMTERELKRNPILGWIAAVPMRPGSPGSVLSTLRRLRTLREQRPEAVILFFPQGRIWPSQRRPLGFQRGVATLARVLAPVQVLPVALHVEPLNAARPALLAAAGPILRIADGDRLSASDLEATVARQLDAIAGFLARHGEDAGRWWPDEWSALPAAAVPTEPSVSLAGARSQPATVRPEYGNGRSKG